MTIRLSPGTLWPAIRARGEAALACGALHPIETETRYLEQAGVRFQLRVVSSLARKDADKQRIGANSAAPANPFLPYDAALHVADISDTHACLLNKFNVIEHHVLLVTRAFEHQAQLLTMADFAALAACMREYPALGFYNGGPEAGASQPHKHLQLVPLPLGPVDPPVPVEALFPRATAGHVSLPFRHAFARLDAGLWEAPTAVADLHARYRALFEQVLARPLEGMEQPCPYNLLLTRAWMLFVPRRREHFASISINALGYAGSFFLRNEAELARVKAYGPMEVLRDVGIA